MTKEEKNTKDNWRLERLSVHYIDYGDDKGKHKGSIEFANGSGDKFLFSLDVSRTTEYMDLIRVDVIKNAKALGKMIELSIEETGR